MSIPLYMDVHVAIAVTRALRAKGVDVLTAQEDGRQTLPDPELLDRAGQLGRALVTHDADFLEEATRRTAESQPFAGVIYAHQMHITLAQLIDDLELIALAADPDDIANRIEWLPLRR